MAWPVRCGCLCMGCIFVSHQNVRGAFGHDLGGSKSRGPNMEPNTLQPML